MKTIRLILASTILCVSAAAFGAQPAKSAPKAAEVKLVDVAICNDGKTYSNATGEHRGACSGHRGVAQWLDGSPVRAKKASSYR